MMSTKRADCGQPEIAVIALGFESGHVKFFLENGVVILEYQLHWTPVQRIRFRGFSASQPESSFVICYSDCVVEIDGMELYQTLRVARVSPEQGPVRTGYQKLDRFQNFGRVPNWTGSQNCTGSTKLSRFQNFGQVNR